MSRFTLYKNPLSNGISFHATSGDFSNIVGCALRFEIQNLAAAQLRKGTGGLEPSQRFLECGPSQGFLERQNRMGVQGRRGL